MASDEPPVDFVVGAPEPAGPAPPPRDARARNRRLRVELGIGALVLLVIVLVARGSSGRHSVPVAAPTTPALTTPAVTTTPPTAVAHTPFPARVPERTGSDPAACPGLRCTSSTELPPAVTRAIQDAFPESTVERSTTVRLRGAGHLLWYREVDVRVASQLLTVRVQAPAAGDRPGSGHRVVHGQRTTYVWTSLGPWHVEVSVVDLLGGQASSAPLTALAHDPRLVAA